MATIRSCFDAWSLVHLSIWVVIGAFIRFHMRRRSIRQTSDTMVETGVIAWLGTCVWGMFQRFVMEPHGWMAHSVWYKSWISDPTMAVVGVLLGLLCVCRSE